MSLATLTRPLLRWPDTSAAILSILLLIPSASWASPPLGTTSNANLLGSATFRFFGLPIYDAKLFTPAAAPFNWQDDFGLEFTYRKALQQKALVDSTLDEMSRQGNSAPIRRELETCFKSVRKGDSYVAVSDGPDRIDFWRNGKKTCTLSYPEIKVGFMSIFLGETSRSPRFTRQLKGK